MDDALDDTDETDPDGRPVSLYKLGLAHGTPAAQPGKTLHLRRDPLPMAGRRPIDRPGVHPRPADVAGAVADPAPAVRRSLRRAARDYIWLHDLRHGVNIAEIAARERILDRHGQGSTT